MDILLLGNGFDIDNDFPTKYKDFIEFIDNLLRIKNIVETNKKKNISDIIDKICKNKKNSLKKYYYYLFINKIEIKNKFICLLENNSWYLHFSRKINKLHGDRWLDFETEIDNIMDVFKRINNAFERIGDYSREFIIDEGILEIINMLNIPKGGNTRNGKYKISDKIKFKKTLFYNGIEKLYNDLNNLTEGFRIYLIDYINKLPIKYYNPDIRNISPDLILSFNYTNTYERHFVYGESNNCYHINGNAEYFANGNNLVLGIETDDRTFFRFEKSWQRVNKGEYKKSLNIKDATWLDIIKNNEEKKLYIFGHSLTIFDREILESLILRKNMKTIIFYHDINAKTDIENNLMNLLGYDKCLELQRNGKIVMHKKSNKKLILNDFEIIIKLLFNTNISYLRVSALNKIVKMINEENKDYFGYRENVAIAHFALNNLKELDEKREKKLVNIAKKLNSEREFFNYEILITYCKEKYQYDIVSHYDNRIKTQEFIQKVLENNLISV